MKVNGCLSRCVAVMDLRPVQGAVTRTSDPRDLERKKQVPVSMDGRID